MGRPAPPHARHRLGAEGGVWLLSGALLLGITGLGVDLSLPFAALAVPIALLGVPHGALDPVVAWEAGWLAGRRGLVFAGGYLALAAVTLLGWWIAPATSLVMFLLLSAWHFGSDWRDALPGWVCTLAGAAVILAPLLCHPHRVETAFAALVPPASAGALIDVGRPLAAVGLAALLPAGAWYARRQPWRVGEIALLPALAAALPPLVFFTVYFCLLHSPRHIRRVVRGSALAPPTLLAAGAAVLTVTLGGAVAAWVLAGETAPDQRLLRIVFVGLSALTVPHLVLVEGVRPWAGIGGAARRAAGHVPARSAGAGGA